jgi:hypothetical protein
LYIFRQWLLTVMRFVVRVVLFIVSYVQLKIQLIRDYLT